MCDCPAETLGTLILAAVRQNPGVEGTRLLGSLGADKICLIHFCGALHALARKEFIRSGDPDHPIRPGMGPTRLVKLGLVPGDAALSVSVERRIDILRELWESLPRTDSDAKVLILDKRFKVYLNDVLGRGGSGAVYRGEQISLARRVAVKIISLDRLPPSVSREAYLERFEREPRILATLNHPHIVQVIDGGREGDLLWHVMEYLEGGTLCARVEREGPLPAPTVLEYMLSVTEALEAAAAHKIQHRDVKPENIFNAGMKLADFGLAKVAAGAQGEGKELTRVGSFLGTFPYIAPERASLEPGDERSDLYSLGAAMYYAASGRYLFEKQNLDRAEWIHHHVSVEPVPLWRRVPDFSRDASKVIHRCLAKDPDQRYLSSAELASALRKLIPTISVAPTRSIEAWQEPPADRPAPTPSANSGMSRGGATTVISSALANLDIEVLELFAAYEERYGAGCWTFNAAFQRGLWELAKVEGLAELCARISRHSGSSFERHVEEGLSASEAGEGTAPVVSADFRDYVWLAMRQAAEENARGYLADMDPAERLIRFLESQIDSPALRAVRRADPKVAGRAPPAPADGAGPSSESEGRPGEPTPLLELAEPDGALPGEAPPLEKEIGPYELQGLVGHGGMANVYRARDPRIGRTVALKVLHTQDPEMVSRFRREAQIAGQLRHPGIATIYDVGQESGRCYIAMQFVDGGSIDSVPRPIPTSLELVRDAARALQHAHEQGVIHRDVKPANILVDQGGHVYLTDFGVAKHVRAEGLAALSVTGTVLGTPEYMSPEQARGDAKHVDARSDVYSLGATLYTLLARRPPFSNPNVGDLLFEVVKKKAPPIRFSNPRVSPELELLAERAMAKNSDRRIPSMAEFARQIDVLLAERRYEGRYGLAKVLARKWTPVAAAALVLAFGVRVAASAWSERRVPTVAGTVEDLYRAASLALGSVERDSSRMSPDQRRIRMNQEVFRRLDEVLRREPRHLGARVARLRALYVSGQPTAAKEGLPALREFGARDYRIPFLEGILGIEEALAVPPPLPLPESDPLVAKGGGPERMQAARSCLESVLRRAPDSAQLEEYRRDRVAAAALLPFVLGQWEEAAKALLEVGREQELPVYRSAWCRAAYLSGHFGEVRSSPWSRERRERLGSKLALLLDELKGKEERPPSEESMASEFGPDPEAELVALVASARQAVLLGQSPEGYVRPALSLSEKGGGWIREYRGVALACRLRFREESWEDSEKDYALALGILGDDPTTSLGELARIECTLGLARARIRGSQDARAAQEQAVLAANRLSSARPEWIRPKVLRGEARVALGQAEDAWADLVGPAEAGKPDLEALLAASSLWTALAQRERKSGQDGADQARRALQMSARALALVPEHPVALTLHSDSALFLVQGSIGRGRSEADQLLEIIRTQEHALSARPDYVKARWVLASALFLRGEAALGASGGRVSRDHEEARRQLDVILGNVPDHPNARFLRGLIRFISSEWEAAALDWTELIARHPSWDSPELREWLRRAKGDGKQP